MTVDDAIALFLDHRRDRIAESSLETYSFWLTRWATWRRTHQHPPALSAVSLTELTNYLRSMKDEELSPESMASTWRILKSLWRLLDRRKLLNDAQRTIFDPEDGLAQPRVPEIIRPLYDDATIEKLLTACTDDTPERQARNKAIILLLWESGMRVSELCSMQDELTDLDKHRAVIVGKGSKRRWVYWHDRAGDELRSYLDHRRGAMGGPLLRDLNDGQALNREAIRSMLRRRAKAAGVALIPGAPLHGFRHKFAHDALDAGISDLDLQQLMGHASIVSTIRYTRRDPEKLGKIHQRIKR